jgi:hypothetical protein
LEAHPEASELQTARSLYVIDFEKRRVQWPPPYRIVYRLLPADDEPEKAQVISADRRDQLQVYRTGLPGSGGEPTDDTGHAGAKRRSDVARDTQRLSILGWPDQRSESNGFESGAVTRMRA